MESHTQTHGIEAELQKDDLGKHHPKLSTFICIDHNLVLDVATVVTITLALLYSL